MLRLPRGAILTAVIIFCIVGSFALRNNMFDVWVMLAAGIAGFFLEAKRVPLAPIILGMILGPMIEENLRVGLIKSSGEIGPFIARPICCGIWIALVGALAYRPATMLVQRIGRTRIS